MEDGFRPFLGTCLLLHRLKIGWRHLLSTPSDSLPPILLNMRRTSAILLLLMLIRVHLTRQLLVPLPLLREGILLGCLVTVLAEVETHPIPLEPHPPLRYIREYIPARTI